MKRISVNDFVGMLSFIINDQIVSLLFQVENLNAS